MLSGFFLVASLYFYHNLISLSSARTYQLLYKLRGRILQNLFRSCILFNLSLIKNQHTASKLQCLFNIMSDKEDCDSTVFMNPTDLLLKLSAVISSTAPKGFIHQKDLRSRCQCSGNSDTLTLSTGQKSDRLLHTVF